VRRYTVIFDRDAEADLLSIRDYIARVRDPDFAQRFVEKIVDYCELFDRAPHRGTLKDEVRPGLRIAGWRKTVTIAFEVIEDKRQVNVLGVFYRGRDVLEALEKRKK
jgi:toxin ParE1/3/4